MMIIKDLKDIFFWELLLGSWKLTISSFVSVDRVKAAQLLPILDIFNQKYSWVLNLSIVTYSVINFYIPKPLMYYMISRKQMEKYV